MAKPQQPELRRSERVPALDPDASEAVLSAESVPAVNDPDGPVPPEQTPGHRPDHDQDKPDLDAFAARLGVRPDESDVPDEADVHESDVHDEASAGEPDEPLVITTIRKRRRALALAIAAPAAAFVVVRGLLRWRR